MDLPVFLVIVIYSIPPTISSPSLLKILEEVLRKNKGKHARFLIGTDQAIYIIIAAYDKFIVHIEKTSKGRLLLS